MKKDIEKLNVISNKKNKTIIGLMSGTSLDGLDVALCNMSGNGLQTTVELQYFETVNYEAEFKEEVLSIFSKKNIDLEKLTLLNEYIGITHGNIINKLLKKWNINNEDVDIIASHGQTIYHAPKHLHQQKKYSNATLQIGDADHIAVTTKIITLSDFRQKHIAAGGEGAPLAVYGDYLVFGKPNEDRILLNIGGIANFTFLPGNMNTKEIFSTDTGPGNTMMDAFVQQNFAGKYFDENAAIALRGTVNENLLQALLNQTDYFSLPFPKTTGPELFNLKYLQNAKEGSNSLSISVEDTMATLNKLTAVTIAHAIQSSTQKNKNYKIFTSGGGMHNPLLIKNLKELLPQYEFDTTTTLNINPDAKEALLFGILANECICGNDTTFSNEVAGMPNVTMGKISFPN